MAKWKAIFAGVAAATLAVGLLIGPGRNSGKTEREREKVQAAQQQAQQAASQDDHRLVYEFRQRAAGLNIPGFRDPKDSATLAAWLLYGGIAEDFTRDLVHSQVLRGADSKIMRTAHLYYDPAEAQKLFRILADRGITVVAQAGNSDTVGAAYFDDGKNRTLVLYTVPDSGWRNPHLLFAEEHKGEEFLKFVESAVAGNAPGTAVFYRDRFSDPDPSWKTHCFAPGDKPFQVMPDIKESAIPPPHSPRGLTGPNAPST